MPPVRPETAVIALDPEVSKHIPKAPWYRKISRPQSARLDDYLKVHISVSLQALPGASDLVRQANQMRRLRNLFVHDADASNLLPQYLNKAGLRLMRNLLVHQDPAVPARVLQATCIGAEDELVADARLLEDSLVVISCSGKTYEVQFDQISALAEGSDEGLRSFCVVEDGSYVTWPQLDLHLDIDGIRQLVDPDYRKQLVLERIRNDKRFGMAVAEVRTRYGLRQADISGLSERQLRRIEDGARPRAKTLEKLSRAHGLNTNTYLNEVAEAMQARRSPR